MMEYSEIQSGVTVYQKSQDELLMIAPLWGNFFSIYFFKEKFEMKSSVLF